MDTISSRQWKYNHNQHESPSCWDCGLDYGNSGWIECILPNFYWEAISPSHDKGCGTLCITCIVRRLAFINLEDIPVKIFNSQIRIDPPPKG